MIQKHRISTKIGKDQKVVVELKQDYDLLEILSLKFTQVDAYSSMCSDYGVVVGRISANNGFGIPNARVSIFVPLTDEDSSDPVISALYPYTTISDKNEDGYRYNLLPARKQHGGHEPTGTFPDQTDILTREEILEVYEKYYKYTVKTNESGDFMIWGVPVGTQTLHVDVDISDIGCFSLRPDDLKRSGIGGADSFKNEYSYKSSTDLDSLPQITQFNQTIEVYPFWGNEDLCEIGITRSDFDLSTRGIKIEPKAYLLGSIYSDSEKNALSYNGTPKKDMGNKCNLVTSAATVEVIRFTQSKDTNLRPVLEVYEVEQDIEENGSFVMPLPMNLEYVVTNEFGETEITNDPDKGIATAACYRFRISTINDTLANKRGVASYLVPNIREYTNDIDKSYAWSTVWDDYPTDALSDTVIFNSVQGSFYPQDYFYRVSYNKVYAVSSFMGGTYSSGGSGKQTFLGIKEIAPREEEDCQSEVLTPPTNFGMKKYSFSILLATIINAFERVVYTALVGLMQVLIIPFQALFNWHLNIGALGITIIDYWPFRGPSNGGSANALLDMDIAVIEPLQRFGTVNLGIVIYPDCDNCDIDDDTPETPDTVIPDPDGLYELVAYGVAGRDYQLELIQDYTDLDIDTNEIVFSDDGSFPDIQFNMVTQDLPTIMTNYLSNNGRYIIKIIDYLPTTPGGATVPATTTLNIDTYDLQGITGYKMTVTNNSIYFDFGSVWQYVEYEIYDTQFPLTSGSTTGSTITINESDLGEGCSSYVSVYDETIVRRSYCVSDITTPYSGLTNSDLYLGTSCSTGVLVGQTIHEIDSNPCKTCRTKSGYSEFRYGVYTIIPAASITNWNENFKAIKEYCRRKLTANVFCGGVVNYSFTDNWLTGSLYMFPFKRKVRWDDEGELDLNYRRTRYFKDLIYFKVKETESGTATKQFYYRSSKYSSSLGEFLLIGNRSTLGHPTTIVDLGPRDEFIKEICTDPNLDPNCSVAREVGPTSFQDFRNMLSLYIGYRLDVDSDYNWKSFFANNGYNSILPPKMDGEILNGDILQLISMNCEAGIEGFDLDNKNYSGYNPQVLDPENYPSLFQDSLGNWGPLPINLVLAPDGYRVRVCLNEPGRLTESSQTVPFFYWNKNGIGFGIGVNQAWDYLNIQAQPLQGMEANYAFTYDSTHKYVLFPMTKSYIGQTITIGGVDFNDVTFDVESTTDTHSSYDGQEEGFTFLHVTSWSGGTTEAEKIENATAGTLYVKGGVSASGWASVPWTSDMDFIIKPTAANYTGPKQILSTPFLYYFGLRPGNTAIDKFIKLFGPKGAFPNAE